jgi:tRNA A-37 threonylcarbamoyl transferase component Bud32
MTAAPSVPPVFSAGHRLGRYELIRRLAVGGMAEIYLARVPGLGIEGFEKLVVIKRILPQHALDPELLRMFLDEARLSATLTHPHITEVYDVGADGEAPFFAMEYVHGANLRQMLKRTNAAPLPLNHAVAIVAAAAAGLHYAHEKLGPGGEPLNIVHRDVSPSNVLISYDGAVKVSDFGIAKWTFQRTQTQEGALKGKFAYMSPEQCRGQAIDQRSDVFALGTLLYELTTGEPPFRAATDFEILTQIINGAPAPPAWPGRDYPAALAAIVMRALAREPGDRYPTAQAFQLELEAFARAEQLAVSTAALGAFMQMLFSDELSEWREAHRAGKSLGDHLAEREAGRLQPTVVATLTDAFAAGRPRPRRSRALLAGAALVALALVGGGAVVAARRHHGQAAAQPAAVVVTPPAPSPPAAAASTAVAAKNNVEDHSSAPRTAAPPKSRRAGRPRPPAATPAPAPSPESRLRAWDPDSPVPP